MASRSRSRAPIAGNDRSMTLEVQLCQGGAKSFVAGVALDMGRLDIFNRSRLFGNALISPYRGPWGQPWGPGSYAMGMNVHLYRLPRTPGHLTFENQGWGCST